MKVKLQTSASGPEGFVDAGSVVQVPDAFGKHLIQIGSASEAGPDDKPIVLWPHRTDVPKPKPETATKDTTGEAR